MPGLKTLGKYIKIVGCQIDLFDASNTVIILGWLMKDDIYQRIVVIEE
jgi:hypothetical protein